MTTHATWPAEHFYWALLDAPGVRNTGTLPPGLTPILEEFLPVDVNLLHAVCVPLTAGRLAVCASPWQHLADLPPGTLTLSPATLPPFLASEGIASTQFNLLIEAFEPAPLRLARLKRHATMAALVAICGVLAAIGLHRRESHLSYDAKAAQAASLRLADSIVPGCLPQHLATHANHLQIRHDALKKAAHPPDASLSLAALLHAWPATLPSKPQSISVTPTGISVSVSLDGDPAKFLEALSPPAGWSPDEPRLNSAGSVTRLSLQFRPMGSTP
jgi:hypothetical protein